MQDNVRRRGTLRDVRCIALRCGPGVNAALVITDKMTLQTTTRIDHNYTLLSCRILKLVWKALQQFCKKILHGLGHRNK